MGRWRAQRADQNWAFQPRTKKLDLSPSLPADTSPLAQLLWYPPGLPSFLHKWGSDRTPPNPPISTKETGKERLWSLLTNPDTKEGLVALGFGARNKQEEAWAGQDNPVYRAAFKLGAKEFFGLPWLPPFLALWLSDPTEIPRRETGVAIPLPHCVFCGIPDYRCYTPTSFRKNGLTQSKRQALEGGYHRKACL